MPPVADVAAILTSLDFNRFLNLAEDQFLEVKSAPYELTQPTGRYELAKDVAPLATTQGGYLIIGLGTTRNPAADQDVIDRLTLIPEADFDVVRYRGIIGNHTHPAIENLRVEWISAGARCCLARLLRP